MPDPSPSIVPHDGLQAHHVTGASSPLRRTASSPVGGGFDPLPART